MDIYAQIAEKIIKAQEAIIGPVAVEQASNVANLKVDWPNHKISISGDEAKAIDQLVDRYKDIFGQVSVEVCKEAAAPLIGRLQADQLPQALR